MYYSGGSLTKLVGPEGSHSTEFVRFKGITNGVMSSFLLDLPLCVKWLFMLLRNRPLPTDIAHSEPFTFPYWIVNFLLGSISRPSIKYLFDIFEFTHWKTLQSISAITRMCRDRMDKQRTLDFHLMSRMNRFVDRVTHLHDSQITMKKVTQIYKGVITVTYCFQLL